MYHGFQKENVLRQMACRLFQSLPQNATFQEVSVLLLPPPVTVDRENETVMETNTG